MTFGEWLSRHMALFGLQGDSNERSGEEWVRYFRAENVVPGELWDASQWLAANATLGFPSEHLPALRDRVRFQRREVLARAAHAAEVEDRGRCVDCGGCGWVIVRRPPAMGGSVHYRTMAVTCVCWAGRNRQNMLANKPVPSQRGAPLSLADYRLRYPVESSYAQEEPADTLPE